MIDKSDLFRMKLEFPENFSEFFQGAIGVLQKFVKVKLSAMQICYRRFKAWSDGKCVGLPNYDIDVPTNQEIEKMKYQQVLENIMQIWAKEVQGSSPVDES